MTRLVQVALHASDLDRAAAFYGDLLGAEVADVRRCVEELRVRTDSVSGPHALCTHEDDALGPAGTTEWQAFVTDSEGNLLGLVSFESSA